MESRSRSLSRHSPSPASNPMALSAAIARSSCRRVYSITSSGIWPSTTWDATTWRRSRRTTSISVPSAPRLHQSSPMRKRLRSRRMTLARSMSRILLAHRHDNSRESIKLNYPLLPFQREMRLVQRATPGIPAKSVGRSRCFEAVHVSDAIVAEPRQAVPETD